MNLDEIKKLSEIFVNIAQPVATLIVGIVTVKASKKKATKNSKKKRK